MKKHINKHSHLKQKVLSTFLSFSLMCNLIIGPKLETDARYFKSFQTMSTVEHEHSLQIESPTVTYYDGPDFDVNAALALAHSENGLSFPTGWNAPGECLIAALRWVGAGGANIPQPDGTPLGNYTTAREVSIHEAQAGDIVQYIYTPAPWAFAPGIHTVMIAGNNGDGTFSIFEANNPGGSGLVSHTARWTPQPPWGFEVRVFRF